MQTSLTAVAVAAAIYGLEWAKLRWHRNVQPVPVILHAALACALGIVGGDPVFVLGGAAVVWSYFTIDSKRDNKMHGKMASLLSSWPFEVAALVSLGWWGIPAGVLAGRYTLRLWIRDRPAHWGPSFWERVFPDVVIKYVK